MKIRSKQFKSRSQNTLSEIDYTYVHLYLKKSMCIQFTLKVKFVICTELQMHKDLAFVYFVI